MIVVNSSTRQFNIPGADVTFGVESDSGSERKYFQCPRYVGNNLDVAASFVRINYRNANGDIDTYLVNDLTVDGDNVLFSWELYPKVTQFKGQVKFVLCVVGPDTRVKWHTTLGTGQVHEGLEPDHALLESDTADVVAQLIAMVEAQTDAVEAEGSKQIKAVQTAAQTAQSAAVAEIEAKGVNVRDSIPDDYTALSEAVDRLSRGRAGAIVCEVEGSAITVSDASDLPMQGMRIFGRSIQDGTPTPDAPVEIKSVEKPVVTVAGKNLVNINRTDIGKTNATIVVNGETIVVTTASDDAFSRISIPVTYPTNTPLTISFNATILQGYDFMTSKVMAVYMRKGNSNYGATNLTVTKEKCSYAVTIPNGIPEVGCSLWLYIKTSAEFIGTVEVKFENIQIEIGSEATAYEPYKPVQTVELTHTLPGIPVASGGNYTDATGQQWVCDEVDLERGVYVQRVKIDTVSISSRGVLDNGLSAGIYKAPDKLRLLAAGAICDRAKFVGISGAAKNPNCFYENINNFGFTGTETDTLETLQATYDGATAMYILATPIETPLSETEIASYRALHTNKPNTTVLNNAGAHMAVAYSADTKLYIDNKIKEALK